MYVKIVAISLLISLVTSMELVSQNVDTPFKQYKYSSSISIGASFNNYYDNNPIIQLKHRDKPGWLNLGKHIRINHQIGSRNEIQVWLNQFGTCYYDNAIQSRSQGDIIERLYITVSLDLIQYILYNQKFLVDISAGMLYRHGYESILISYGYFDLHSLIQELDDLGINIGIRYSRFIAKERIQLSFEPVYTYIFLRNDKGNSIYTFDTGSTKNMTRFVFIVGYRLFRNGNNGNQNAK